MDCVTEICVTAVSRMMYRDHSPQKDSYAEYFHNLLYLEEYVSSHKLHQYNMKDVPLEIVSDKHLELEVSVGTLYMSVCGAINVRDVSGGIVTDLDLNMKACFGVVPLTVLLSVPLIYCAVWYLFLLYQSIHWHVQNAVIPCCSQEPLPFLPVMHFFLPLLSANHSSILPHFIQPSISWFTSWSCCFQIHIQYSFGNPIFFHSLYVSKPT